MKCYGAQSVVVTEKTAPMPVVEMPCRRSEGSANHHTFFKAAPVDQPEMTALQVPLFDEEFMDTLRA